MSVQKKDHLDVRIPEELLRRFNDKCKERKESRSEVVRRLISQYVEAPTIRIALSTSEKEIELRKLFERHRGGELTEDEIERKTRFSPVGDANRRVIQELAKNYNVKVIS